MQKDSRRKELGRQGEDIACSVLESKGMTVVRRNFRSGHKEIDIICRDGANLRFVEVKTRQLPMEGEAWEAVNYFKQKNVVAGAKAYLASDDFKEHVGSCNEIFFDILTVVWSEDGSHYDTEYIPDAFRPIYV